MLINKICQITEEVVFDNVDPVGFTEVLESHSQLLSSEELYDMALQLPEQQKEDEDEEDHETKEMQMKDLTDILSTIDIAAEKFSDIDLEWERSSTVKRGIRAVLHPYYKILQEKKIKQVDVTFFLDVF